MTSIRIALCQINSTVGDIDSNSEKIIRAIDEAEKSKADLAIFPELAIAGYPPEDLVFRRDFVEANAAAMEKLAGRSGDAFSAIGFVEHDGENAYNAAALLKSGQRVGTYRKQTLPNYAVFDERRTFKPGDETHSIYQIAGIRVGFIICEDAWVDQGPIEQLTTNGAQFIAILNASPYYVGRAAERLDLIAKHAIKSKCAIAYVNCVGGQDELVFDGGSFVVDADGKLLASAAQFSELNLICDINIESSEKLHEVSESFVEISNKSRAEDRLWPSLSTWLEESAEIYQALVLGTRDYVRKNGFSDVVIGLSGGIDSALVACIASDALGPQHVHAVLMPSEFTSSASNEDAAMIATKLKIDQRTIPIDSLRTEFANSLAASFAGLDNDVTEENIQSRIRGSLLMALSNKMNWLTLATGNKSELAVGYSTLYGDSVGGFSVIKDVLKTQVYELANYRNTLADVPIPRRVIDRAPSAELRDEQRDDQSIPAYEVLDPIIRLYVENDSGPAQLAELGFDREVIREVLRLIDRAEFKRRQMPPGVRVSAKAFGRDRRLPITNKFVD